MPRPHLPCRETPAAALAPADHRGSRLLAAVKDNLFLRYGGMIRGVFPSEPGISWQGHLFGFLAGVVTARLLFPPKARPGLEG